jgi:hypothetical protein
MVNVARATFSQNGATQFKIGAMFFVFAAVLPNCS